MFHELYPSKSSSTPTTTSLATEIKVELVLLPKNNIFQRFIALRTRIKHPKAA
jgi:hypothetical protein